MKEVILLIYRLLRHNILDELTKIKGYAELMEMEKKHDSKYNSEIISAALKIERNIESFGNLFFFLQKEKKETADIGETFEETIDKFFPEIRREITIEIQCQTQTILPKELLKSIFYILIDNTLNHAFDSHQGKKKIMLDCRKEKEKTIIVYQDNGAGIPEKDKKKIFQESPVKTHALYLLKEIFNVLRWKIKEEGISGKGAKFVLII